jgi:hypothetical protein
VLRQLWTKNKWLLIGVYKPPTVLENIFTSDFIKRLDQVTCNYDNFMVLGDLRLVIYMKKKEMLSKMYVIFLI